MFFKIYLNRSRNVKEAFHVPCCVRFTSFENTTLARVALKRAVPVATVWMSVCINLDRG